MTEVLATPMAHALGLALVHFVWQGAAIGLATALLLTLARRTSAQTRYLMACLGLAALALTPAITTMRIAGDAPTGPAVVPSAVNAVGAAANEGAGSGGSHASAQAQPPRTLDGYLPGIVLTWSLGVLMLTVRLARGWLDVQHLKRHVARDIVAPSRAVLDRVTGALRVTRYVHLAESSMVEVPTVIGWIRPTILVPAAALAGLTPSQLEAIFAHEVAHIRRHDYLVNGFQHVVETLLFYHPAVWWVSRQMRLEREYCCDNIAVELVGSRVLYAGALASLEESRERTIAFGVAATGGHLLSRVRRVLGTETDTLPQPSLVLISCVVVGLAVVGMTGRAADAGPGTTQKSAAAADAPEALTLENERLRGAYDQLLAAKERVVLETASSARTAGRGTAEGPVGATTTTAPVAPAHLADDRQAEVDSTQLLAIDQQYRQALASANAAAAAAFLNDGFLERDPEGTWRSRDGALTQAASRPARSIAFELSAIQVAADSVIVSGLQTETSRTAATAYLVTRVWVRSKSNQWTLLSSTLTRSPRQTEGRTAPPVVEATSIYPARPTFRARVPLPAPPDASATNLEVRPEGPRDVMPVPSHWPTTRVGGAIGMPALIGNVRPVYPKEALASGVSGIVIMEAVIDESGAVTDARVLRGHDLLNQAALDAVLQWRFTPATANGVPVAVVATFTVDFQTATVVRTP